MGDSTSTRATLRNKFELEKRHRSYAEFRPKSVKTPADTKPSPSNSTQKQKPIEIEEFVKHMNRLPSYLERGKPIQDRVLNFGVMDWGRLEKWQYRNNKLGLVKCSPSSSITSSLFSTDGSSPQSSSVPSCSPARQKVHRVTLQSHFKASPNVKSCSGNPEKFRHFKDASQQSEIKLDTGSFQNESANEKSQMQLDSSRNRISPSRNKTPERKRLIDPSKNSDLKTGNISVNKQRSISPLRRFSFSFTSAMKKAESPPESYRAHSSPLRRLLDPIIPSKTRQFSETGHEDSKMKAKTKLDFKNLTGTRAESLSRKQALFQAAIKNGRLLFTFTVENNDILAATVTGFNSPGKNDVSNRIYTFFTVHEVKKKTGSWLTQGGKTKDSGYVPNVAAQMKVSNPLNSDFNTREFVLFSVDSNIQLLDELEAIVVEYDRGGFSTTVILPGGNHGAPSKGGPSPLVDRWRSGGVCDCGGWDIGCRLRVLTSRVQSGGSRPAKVHMNAGQFELFFQGEIVDKKPLFSLSPLKEGIFSVEYNSSVSLLQAFSICISVAECGKSPRHL